MSRAIYPGSFDPITHGHLDVVRRACAVFDGLVVAVLVNPRKQPELDANVRAQVIREALDEELGETAARVDVEIFDGLTVDLARRTDAAFIVRGLRAISDFESELQMAHMNRKLAPAIDTVFFMTGIEHAYLSSSLVREIARLGGDVSAMVPRAVLRRLPSAAPSHARERGSR
jgi:pantetheine-phosphate adenylyltransferase